MDERNYQTQLEIEIDKAIHAYEEFLTAKNGRRTAASRTRQMLKRHGYIETMERLMRSTGRQAGFIAVMEKGLQELTFEAVIVRHPKSFTQEAVKRAKQRLEEE
jgi:hypothetical protein